MRQYVKFMVSHRCKMMVRYVLNRLKIPYISVDLGVIELEEPLSAEKHDLLDSELRKSGLELLDDKRNVLVEKVKIVIIEMIHYAESLPKQNYSDYISEKVGYDYTYLSNVFSEVKGMTIQQFIILNKIEKVKELILYDELSISEIAFRLNYSSVAHLSNQFKKVTGLTPAYFKSMAKKRRLNLEEL
jgi:AraC-like DNA-binding protein